MRERAVRPVREVATEQGERHGAVNRVARSLGIGPESVRLWVRKAELEIGPSSYYAAERRPPFAREIADGALTVEVARIHADNLSVYAVRKT